MIKSIKHSIGRFGVLNVKVVVALNNNYTPMNTTKHVRKKFRKWLYTNDGGTMYNYAYAIFINLDFNSSKLPFSKDRSFTIFSCQNWKLVEALQQGLEMLNNTDIFYIDKDTKHTCMYADAAKYKITSAGYMNNGILTITPTVVVDINDVHYEGLRIAFNNINNFIDLAIDELRGLLYVLEKTDFVTLGQTLINSLILWASKQTTDELDLEVGSGSFVNGLNNEYDYQQTEDKIKTQQYVSGMVNPFKKLLERKNNGGK
jgi:hypothetical protein